MAKATKQRTGTRTWVFLEHGENRQYGGNTGYDDKTTEHYRYNSDVPNCQQVNDGDIAIVCGTVDVIGVARIGKIKRENGPISHRRCPVCKKTTIKARRASPHWRCDDLHEGRFFDAPLVDHSEGVHFTAPYVQPFLKCQTRIPRALLMDGCPAHRGQFSIKHFDLSLVLRVLERQAPELLRFLKTLSPAASEATASLGGEANLAESLGDLWGEYQPANEYAQVGEIALPEYDPDVRGRGVRAHARLQNELEKFLRAAGVAPGSPLPGGINFDMAWRRGKSTYVAEVKSLTDENEEKQLSLGLGQVLRFAHRIGGREAIPVLMVERAPFDPAWVDLCGTLGVVCVWPENFCALRISLNACQGQGVDK